MNELTNKVTRAFVHLEGHYDVKEIIVSGSNKPGEGEHKMFQHIRKNKNIITGNALIYGLDSDLIMLALFHCQYFHKIYIHIILSSFNYHFFTIFLITFYQGQ